MARFDDYRDWSGEWEGSFDGRHATMRTSASLEPDGRRARLSITYQTGGDTWISELDGGFDALAHEVRDRWLRPTGGSPNRERLEWPRLLLHTWDTDFLSGASRWAGKDYGFWFWRRVPGRTVRLGDRRFTSWYGVDGGGDRPHRSGLSWSAPPLPQLAVNDGRTASLAVNITPSGPTPDRDVHLDFRFLDAERRCWRGWRVVRPEEFRLDDLTLEPYDRAGFPPGTGTLRWPRFSLHTWDTRQASGWSEWEGKAYGLLFHNGALGTW